jgi:hypothetical protein
MSKLFENIHCKENIVKITSYIKMLPTDLN